MYMLRLTDIWSSTCFSIFSLLVYTEFQISRKLPLSNLISCKVFTDFKLLKNDLNRQPVFTFKAVTLMNKRG
jgi:hypothetical protein